MTKRLLLCLSAAMLSQPPSNADELRAGSARADITPLAGYALWWYAARKDQPSLGVRDPLIKL